MQLKSSFRLPPILRAVASTAENEHHRILSLQLGELPSLCSVVGKLVVGEHSPRNNVRSHIKPLFLLEYATLSVKNPQSLAPTRRFHLRPYPMQNDLRQERGLQLSLRPYDSVPAHRHRTRGHTCPKSPAGAAASRASMPATLDT